MKKVIIDVFGADTPDSLIKGAARATLENEDVKILLPGVPQVIEDVLCECEYDPRRIEILPAEQVITNDDDPVNAVFQKRRSSVVTAAKYFAENDDCIGFASAGNTGALLAASTAYVGRLDGIERPSLCTFLPSSKDRFVCMLDCGANVDCKPQQMIQFALMGSALVECCVGVKDPTVAIVSNGTESRKGNLFTREVYSLLEKMPINFVGNMEARDALSGKYDVMVCDGFVGNVLLKSIEGAGMFTASVMLKHLKANMPENTDPAFLKKALGAAMAEMDFSSRGGAVLMGLKKTVMKIHGNSNERTVPNVVKQLLDISAGGFIDRTKELLRAAK